jgi:DNA polymerase III subunit delta'
MLPGLEPHPHAAAVLGAALSAGPSHAYLFQGPAGSGKRDAARAFAAALLAEGAGDPDNAAQRARNGVHPDLTWVAPSGAHEMLRSDVSEAVVAAATHTPFESARRLFVLERVDTMNDEAANTLLKTLEEPPSYVVLILLSDRPDQVLPTIASRCQPVRFDAVAPSQLAAALEADGVAGPTARACASLALGDGERARFLAGAEGTAIRRAAEAFAADALSGDAPQTKPWGALLSAAVAQGKAAREALEHARDRELELLPKKEQRRKITEYEDRIKRAERRARTHTIDHGLQLAGLWLRDLACVASGAADLVHNADRVAELERAATGREAAALREGVGLVEDTRARLLVNVSEELALEALAYRLERLSPVAVG